MKNNLTKTTCLLLLSIIFNSNQYADNKENIKKEDTVLLEAEKALLNSYLASHPVKVLQIKTTTELSKRILQNIEKLEKENKKEAEILSLIKENKAKLLKAANPFFELLYPVKSYLAPLAKRVLEKKSDPNEIEKNKNINKSSSSDEIICLLYFQASENEAKTFFEKTLNNSLEIIKKACAELHVFCNTILENLDSEILKKAEELARKVQIKKK